MAITLFRTDKALRKLVDEDALKRAITQAEQHTTGEIKLFIERTNPYMNVVERAAEVFYDLQMQKTERRNAVLVYLAYKDHEFALFGDQGIFEKYTQQQWQELCDDSDALFTQGDIQSGLELAIAHLGEWLTTQFPLEGEIDRNELPDEIVFGL